MKGAREIVGGTEHCTWCPTLCLHACPVCTAVGSDVVSPWGKMSLARWLASGRAELGEQTVRPLYACASCGACSDACKHGIDVAGILRSARCAVVAEGLSPEPPEFWSAPIERDDQAILGPGVTGVRLFEAGYTDRFLQVARAAARRWSRRPEIVFASAEDASCARNVYPEHGIQLSSPVVLASERPGARPNEPLDGPAAWFEPCHLARGGGDTALALENARRAAGGELIELRWRGESATCCGAGGVWGALDPDGAARAAQRILDNAIDRGAKALLTGCAGCARHLAASAGDRAITVQALGTGDLE